MRTNNITFERVEGCKYIGKIKKNQNSIREEIKSILISGNACYHSVQNFLSSRMLSKNLKIKEKNYNFCLHICMGVKLGC